MSDRWEIFINVWWCIGYEVSNGPWEEIVL